MECCGSLHCRRQPVVLELMAVSSELIACDCCLPCIFCCLVNDTEMISSGNKCGKKLWRSRGCPIAKVSQFALLKESNKTISQYGERQYNCRSCRMVSQCSINPPRSSTLVFL